MSFSMISDSAGVFPLNDVKKAEYFREQFPYSQVPRILFDEKTVPMNPPEDIWITDTTFRDGQQARPPYTPEQIVALFDMMHRLGGKTGVIRQSEFFLYSDRDKEAVQKCLDRGYEFPEITGWIRANSDDLQIVKNFGIRETGILTSVSDYHIFLKLKKNRSRVMEEYLAIVKAALDAGIIPRCHFEDITRADIYGFCLPFAQELLKLARESGTPVKVRLCDTMGYGISYPGAVLPRSVPKLAHAFTKELGYPSEWLEWHGHNDFHKVHINGTTGWLYGISALNASLLGFGERTGNPPLEGAIMEYIGLKGDTDGIDTTVITEIADYFRNEINAPVPDNYPFVGVDFNTTRAGIHADGLIKNQEIYNIFDTDAILNRPLKVTVTDKSGMAGIAHWINENIPHVSDADFEPVSKRHPGVANIYHWVKEQYEQGRTTGISPEELIAQTKHYVPSLFQSEFTKVFEKAKAKAVHLAEHVSKAPEMVSLEKTALEKYLRKVMGREKSIQLLAITNLDGYRISQVHTQRGEKGLFRNLMNKDFKEHDWFLNVLETKKPFYSHLHFSRYTHNLIITSAQPLFNSDREMIGVINIDFKFDELAKLINPIPDEILDTKKE